MGRARRAVSVRTVRFVRGEGIRRPVRCGRRASRLPVGFLVSGAPRVLSVGSGESWGQRNRPGEADRSEPRSLLPPVRGNCRVRARGGGDDRRQGGGGPRRRVFLSGLRGSGGLRREIRVRVMGVNEDMAEMGPFMPVAGRRVCFGANGGFSIMSGSLKGLGQDRDLSMAASIGKRSGEGCGWPDRGARNAGDRDCRTAGENCGVVNGHVPWAMVFSYEVIPCREGNSP